MPLANDRTPSHLDLRGAYNLRDLGGYAAADGRRVRGGAVFRSDSLHALAPESQQALLCMGLRTVIDLRLSANVAEQPNVFANSPRVAYRNVNLMGDAPLVNPNDASVASLAPDQPPEVYAAILDRRQPWMGEVFKILAAPGALPALYHCNSGRDRTGLVTMLLLSVAGVPNETIIEDYTLSAAYLWRRIVDREAGAPLALRPGDHDATESARAAYAVERRKAPPDAMSASIRHLDKTHGGAEAYLLGAGVTAVELERLREALLA